MRQFQPKRNKYVSKRKSRFTMDSSTVIVVLALVFTVIGTVAINL